jgi:hypothetical protein
VRDYPGRLKVIRDSIRSRNVRVRRNRRQSVPVAAACVRPLRHQQNAGRDSEHGKTVHPEMVVGDDVAAQHQHRDVRRDEDDQQQQDDGLRERRQIAHGGERIATAVVASMVAQGVRRCGSTLLSTPGSRPFSAMP